jgi:hypothetical protein
LRGEKPDAIPLALIIDSPWIRSYLGISHMDYLLDRNLGSDRSRIMPSPLAESKM